MSGVSVSGGSAGKEKGGEVKTAVIDNDGVQLLKKILTQISITNEYLFRIVSERVREEDIESEDL